MIQAKIFVPMSAAYSALDLYFQFPNWKLWAYNGYMQGQDIALLLKLAIQNVPQVPSKSLAEGLLISPSEVSKALKRCAEAGLIYIEVVRKG